MSPHAPPALKSDCVICPQCGRQQDEPASLANDGDVAEATCSICGRDYAVKLRIERSYAAWYVGDGSLAEKLISRCDHLLESWVRLYTAKFSDHALVFSPEDPLLAVLAQLNDCLSPAKGEEVRIEEDRTLIGLPGELARVVVSSKQWARWQELKGLLASLKRSA